MAPESQANPPRILDSTGTPLRVGDRVRGRYFAGRILAFRGWGYLDLPGRGVTIKSDATGHIFTVRVGAGPSPDLIRITDQEEERDG